jgi:D-serine deaminase-like pyridoxal phosphate-dependent protein
MTADLRAAFEGHEPPLAFVDLDALCANADDLRRRAGGKPIRVATKSLRCRGLTERILARDGFAGTLNLTVPEAAWLGVEDAVVGYPWAGALPENCPTLMIDSTEQLDALPQRELDICLDLDVGFWPLGGRLKFGPKRSPVRTPDAARALAREVTRRPHLRLRGVMAYEGQIAGVADAVPGRALENLGVRVMKRFSTADVAERRAAMVAAVREVADLEFVNGGGTGSIESTVAEPAVTEVAAGSGLFAPTLFDRYRAFTPRPAAVFAVPVVRHPGPGVATVLGGGYPASGPAGRSRLPTPVWPEGLRLDRQEGAGEVQTPLLGSAADSLAIGDRVLFRHAKAGELCERFNVLHLVRGDRVIDSVPTYRGEGKAFL